MKKHWQEIWSIQKKSQKKGKKRWRCSSSSTKTFFWHHDQIQTENGPTKSSLKAWQTKVPTEQCQFYGMNIEAGSLLIYDIRNILIGCSQSECRCGQIGLMRHIVLTNEGEPCGQQFNPTSILVCVFSWALCMKYQLCCDYGVMPEKRRWRWGRGCLWSLNWHSQTSVVIYLSNPSDSNSYTLRCLYILTLGLQGHNLKRYPVKNAEKYKIKILHVRRESKWREGPLHNEQDKVKPFTQGLQITNNGAKLDAFFGHLAKLFQNSPYLNLIICIYYLVLNNLIISITLIYWPRCQGWLRV